jgi:hypothetical protein
MANDNTSLRVLGSMENSGSNMNIAKIPTSVLFMRIYTLSRPELSGGHEYEILYAAWISS